MGKRKLTPKEILDRKKKRARGNVEAMDDDMLRDLMRKKKKKKKL